MGRPEAPLDPDGGPVRGFAYELRRLRREAGAPTYRAMAAKVPYSVPTLSRAAGGDQLPSLAVALAYAEACGGDREEWERRWHEASDAAEAARTDGPDAPYGEGPESPYQGLARFEAGDHERFFGRDRLIDEVVELVGTRRFAALFGPSGSGKSSLLRAGLVPALRERTGRFGAIHVLTPGPRPLRTHTAALTSPATPDAEGEGDAADGEGPDTRDTLVVVDQFEEVFTLCDDPAERADFIRLLLAARDPANRLRVVVAVRADFYGRCAAYRELAEALSAASLLVAPMTPDELRRAVVGPAPRAGLIVEREVTRRIVAEIDGEPGGLPLLSHALRETWRRRRGRVLTTAAYEASGGAHGAIARTAEDVYAELTREQRDLARLVLLRLVTPGEGSPDSRRPVPRAELSFGDPAATKVVVEQLAGARLLTLDHDTVDLAHEALLTSWPRLGGWIDEDRERIRTHRRLTEATLTWAELAGESAALYTGTRLAGAEEHFATEPARSGLTRQELAFLNASSAFRASRLRRRRVLLGSVVAVVVLALIAGVVAWQQNELGDRRHREAEARRIVEIAFGMRYADPQRAMRLGVAAWRLADTVETRAALLGAGTQREEDVFAIPDELTRFPPPEQEPGHEPEQEQDQRPEQGGAVRSGDPGGAHFDGPEPGPEPPPDPGTGAAGTRNTPVPVPDGLVISTAPPDTRTGTGSDPDAGTGVGTGTGTDTRVDVGALPLLSADGRTLVLVRHDRIRSWDLSAPHRTTRIHPGPGASPYEPVALDPGGRHLAVADGNGGVRVRDLRTGRTGARLPVAEPTGLTLARGGRVLVAAKTDGTAEVWDVPAGRRVLTAATGGRYGVEAVALSADGSRVAVCGTGRPLGIWDVPARERLPAPAGGPAECVAGAVARAPDGRSVVAVAHRGVRRGATGAG
ncbi:DNA-binding protein, partial [Streptomyces sp. NPDC058953]